MKKYLFWLGLIPLLILSCQLSGAAQPAAPTDAVMPDNAPETIPQTYPLGKGAYWVYQGTVRYEGGEESLQWRVEVTERISKSNVTGYRMRGALSDLVFYAPGRQPSEYAILQVGSSRFYSADLEAYARLTDPEDIFLIGLVQERNLFLELPLVAGSRFCEAEQITRLDESYCWVVGEPETVTLDAAAGGDVQAYPLYYITNPDQTVVYFAPGIGVVAFTYHHSGSASDVQMALVEYQVGESAP